MLKGIKLKKIFLLASSIIILCSSTKCSFNVEGDQVAFIHPSDGTANVHIFTQSNPIAVTDKEVRSLAELEGWVCIPPKNAARYRRKFEKSQK